MFYSCSSVGTAESKANIEKTFWNDRDSEAVTDSLVNEILNSEWVTNFKPNRKPRIVIGKINNLSTKKTDSDLIEKNIERSFINSGKITFISSKGKREEIRNDRKNNTDFASKKEFKKYLKPLKSDYFVDGTFEQIIDSLSNPATKEYKLSIQVISSKNLELVVSKTNVLIK